MCHVYRCGKCFEFWSFEELNWNFNVFICISEINGDFSNKSLSPQIFESADVNFVAEITVYTADLDIDLIYTK